MPLTPSFRRPNVIPAGAAHDSVRSAIQSHDNSITDLNQAIASQASQISALKSPTSSASGGASTTTQVSTENVTTNIVSGGIVNNQSGNVVYTTAQMDNGALIIFSDASPIAVTLNNSVTLPFYCFVVNQGPGLVTLTPQQNSINGNASQTLQQGYFLTLFFDGTQWWSGNIPIVPVNTPGVTHQWIVSYNSTTGVFTLSQPAFTDISGIAAIAQGGTGTSTPSLVSGSGISITGSWPNQTVATLATLLSINGFVTVPPSGATVFPNLQTLGSGGWTLTGGTATSGGTNTGSSAVTYNNTSPSLTPGGSIALTSNGNGYNSQVYTQHANASFPGSDPTLLTDVTVDLWIYIPSTVNSPQALEGPNVTLYNGTFQMYPSIQADSASGFWRVWTGTAWSATSFSCTTFLATKDQWQHLQVHYTFNSAANAFAYQDLMVNGAVVFQHLNQSYTGSLNSGVVSIKTQVQIDNTAGAIATTIYYDAINTTAWTANSFIPAATSTSATAGAASALPATPAGYLPVTINGVKMKLAYYNI